MKKISILLLLFSLVISSYGQELNVTVSVNSNRIQGTNREIFTTLESAIYQFLNNRQWSSATFANNEKIDCSFLLTIQEVEDNSKIKAELFVTARRPIYNSSYTSTTLNWRDSKIEFEYTQGAPIEMQDTYVDNNLVAALAFYSNLILALDFDSFSPLGGASFYRTAQSLASSAQATGWEGWSSFDDNRSRTSIINGLNEESMKPFREYWYTYHRKGLDEMAANPDRGRTTILNGLKVLKEVQSVRGSEIILQMFADAKLEEIVQIASKATKEEKKETYDLLRSIFPALSNKLEPLKK
ncbi:DUF4835 family protein [Bacteroidales bacterium OttesenSCG-928-M11]|nr:DUF4835 family protein [Bacteroidales bacterium OttesenSCG-928-M11]